MRDPRYYSGLKRRIYSFLLNHSLLTAKQWREVLLSTDRTPRTHEEFATTYHMSEPELKMTRLQLEGMITKPPSWREPCPTVNAASAALSLASAGEINGPESSLGATREAALRLLRRRLEPLDVAKIEIALAHYDASGPHPKHIFGAGWLKEDQLRLQMETADLNREEGRQTHDEWLAERRTHLALRLVDRIRYWKQLGFALSVPRWYRELRYRPHGLTA